MHALPMQGYFLGHTQNQLPQEEILQRYTSGKHIHVQLFIEENKNTIRKNKYHWKSMVLIVVF